MSPAIEQQGDDIGQVIIELLSQGTDRRRLALDDLSRPGDNLCL
jgi:hypothetical protein